jgi:hypothetical protein
VPSLVFLLSPANCRGRRAQQVMSETSESAVAIGLRSQSGVPIGELFAQLSALYFRGKLVYAQRFGRKPAGAEAAAFVITPDRGLVAADSRVGLDTLRAFGAAEISLDNPAYRRPLEETAAALASMPDPAEFVLLGSVASEKYVEVLGRAFGPRLKFPVEFVGRGDMSRGGLLLRAAAAGRELEYVPVIGAIRRGCRPPRLEPLSRSRQPSTIRRKV